ncbi:oligosaccharide flippase family protein [Sneathiella litorea]|uniref:Oligosaccharide flippase family protein n=1 Tax=Sneathiella litorea TaxID=2606216 RepID=A0A6L8WBI6_9PROT|nr:oligosaccharide flippase family protein [Sneathiella litorea]MZR32401.1 oligosaccharide flippase family protein [Sneathiella litorea]
MNSSKTVGGRIQVARASAVYLGSQLGARALNFLFFIMLARNLPTAEFGILNFALTVVVFLDIIIDLGLSRYAMREISKYPEKTSWFIGILLPFKLLAATCTYAFVVYAILMWGDFDDDGIVFLIVFLAVFFTAPSMFFENIMQAHQKFSLISFAHVALSVAQIVSGALVILADGSTFAIAFVFSVSNLFYCMLMLRGVLRLGVLPFPRSKLQSFIKLLKPAFPYLCSALIIMLAVRAEFLLLGYFGSAEDLAIYGMGTKIVEASLLLPIVFGTVLAPRFSIAHARPREVLTTLYASGIQALLLIAVPCATLAYGLASTVIWVLPDRDFEQLVPLLQLLFVGYPAACLYLLNTFVLFGAIKQTKPLILLTALAILQIAINMVLQGSFGLWGAAYSFLAFMGVAAVASTIFTIKNFVNADQVGMALVAPVVGALVIVLIFVIAPLESEAAKLPFALGAYFVSIVIIRRLMPERYRTLNFET